MMNLSIVGVATVLCLLVCGAFVITRGKQLRTRHRRYLVLLLAVQGGILVGIGYAFWPQAPWSQATAIARADLFLRYWSAGELDDAKGMLRGADAEKSWPTIEAAANAPETWQLTQFDPTSMVVHGEGVLKTAEPARLTVSMQWDWLRDAWNVSGVEILPATGLNPVSMSLQSIDWTYSAFTWTLTLTGWLLVFLIIRRMWLLIVVWRKQHPRRAEVD